MIAVRHPDGREEVLEVAGEGRRGGSRPAAPARRDGRAVRSRRDREPQPARLRPAVPRDARAGSGCTQARTAARAGFMPRGARRDTVRWCCRARSASTRSTPCGATTSLCASCRAYGLKAVARHSGSRHQTANSCRATRSIPRGAVIPSACGLPTADVVRSRRSRMLGSGAACALMQLAHGASERLADAGRGDGRDRSDARARTCAGTGTLPRRQGRHRCTTAPRCACSRAASPNAIIGSTIASLIRRSCARTGSGPKRDRRARCSRWVDGLVERRLAAKSAARRPLRINGALRARGDVGHDKTRGEHRVRLPRGRRGSRASPTCTPTR